MKVVNSLKSAKGRHKDCRIVRRKGRDGREEWVRIPLTLRDVLHPQFGDVHVLSDPHADDCTYLRVVLKAR